MSEPLPFEFREEFETHFSNMTCHSRLVGSVADTVTPSMVESENSSPWTIPGYVALPSSRSRYILDDVQCRELQKLYSQLYDTSANIELPSFSWKYQSLRVNEKLLGSHKSRSDLSSLVLVAWNCMYFGPVLTPVTDNEILRPARINYFLSHHISINGTVLNHMLVSLSWFQFHPQKDYFGKPLSVWCHNLFEAGSHIIPIQFIKCRIVSLLSKINDKTVLVVNPCIDF